MRLFWKEHIPLLLFYALQLLLVPLLYWLTGDGRPFVIVLYGVLLSTVVLAAYLIYRYVNHRELYRELQRTDFTMEQQFPELGQSPLPEAVHERLRQVARLYQEQLHHYRNRAEQHITFMNRWVHQMKTPISVIQLTLPELEEAAADSIQEELERLRKGLEMVIYTARLDRFEQDFAVRPIVLLQAVNEAVAGNRKLFIRKGIIPEFQIDSQLTVYTDAKWFRFILDQILTNAVNYSAGVGQKVTLSAEGADRRIQLFVRDQGIGITKEDLNRVFNPYFTGERGRQYHESTGMGLYLVKEICAKLGHEVELLSEPGRGTTVKLVFTR